MTEAAKPFHTIAAACEAEVRVRDSRFIAWLAPAQSRAQAEALIAARARQFADARHNCYAFRLGLGEQLLAHSSDAQEPSGSAGRPMLQTLAAHQLTNLVAVVSRYFGGTKLGIGGLMRAYSSAVQAAIARATLVPLHPRTHLRLTYSYHHSAAVEKALHQYQAKTLASDFGTAISRLVVIRRDLEPAFRSSLTDWSGGRVQIQAVEEPPGTA
ncbi:MAG: IMPACT family protein [candidate division KSB1 bacterium]|nr:IMPACT family protein [candidate division KSB1 bacterium]MDZ7272750.1 IMPACT family protein [candidate division KSB1 bacterium]MDZ7284225.1 IMPACT family protein [candidate division KSB1 bacterium]MDZ7297376.1 IMPACT family protein [candidate division KSB1 bacterium]MDZ7309050.1 IMPACT family protein [candidate division KSB1 bacterium]